MDAGPGVGDPGISWTGRGGRTVCWRDLCPACTSGQCQALGWIAQVGPSLRGEEVTQALRYAAVCGGPASLAHGWARVWGPFSWPSKGAGARGRGRKGWLKAVRARLEPGGLSVQWAGQREQEEGPDPGPLFPSPSPKSLPGTEARRQGSSSYSPETRRGWPGGGSRGRQEPSLPPP